MALRSRDETLLRGRFVSYLLGVNDLKFDPYKRPPAARLLAVLTVALLIAWMLHGGDRRQIMQFHRDPAKYAARLESIARHGPAFDIVVALMVVTVIVFAVDGLTSLFGRWLTEREQPAAP